MIYQRGKNIDWPFPQLVAKVLTSICVLVISLWFGLRDSHTSFYIAVLVQSINNFYESFLFLFGYTKYVTIFNLISCCLSVITFHCSVIYLGDSTSSLQNSCLVYIISLFLFVPIAYFISEAFYMIRDNKF